MQEVFSYYIASVYQTTHDEDELKILFADYENADEIIQSIINSYEYWLSMHQ